MSLLRSTSNYFRNKFFLACCYFSHYNQAQKIYNNGEIKLTHKNLSNLFLKVCTQPNINFAKWLYSLNLLNAEDINITFFVCCQIEESSESKLEIIKWLYSLDIITVITLNESFIETCGRNNLKLAIFLYNLGVIDLHYDNEGCFSTSICAANDNDNDVALWLLTLDKFSEERINFLAWKGYNHKIVAVLYRQGYKATSEYMKFYYEEHLNQQKFIERIYNRFFFSNHECMT